MEKLGLSGWATIYRLLNPQGLRNIHSRIGTGLEMLAPIIEGVMKAIAETSLEHQGLLDEYRMASRLWSETKALYPKDSAEVAQATKHLVELETIALALRNPDVAAY